VSRWEQVCHEGQWLSDVGVLETTARCYNPNGYPDNLVRAAVLGAEARRHERRAAGAKKAAATRARRKERLTWDIAKRIVAGHSVGRQMPISLSPKGAQS
jgi:hypothetical protein